MVSFGEELLLILRRVVYLCLISLFMLIKISVGFASPDLEKLTAQAVILIEADTGKVIYEKNAEKKMYPASTTKIMTTILALEKSNLNDVIMVSENAAGTEGSSMQLATGDQLPMIDALYGIMMLSGNDASIAVAEHISGLVENFAALMNEKAQRLGAFHTHFANSCGLPDPNHYTTAHDLARIGAYAYKNPMFREIIKTQYKSFSWREYQAPVLFENTNLLLGNYQGINGMKTGYTEAAGECLVASAERDGVNLIAVVLHCAQDYRWYEAAALLDYGFEKVTMETMVTKEGSSTFVRVDDGISYRVKASPNEDIKIAVSNGDRNRYALQLEVPTVRAPVRKGQAVGKINVLYGEEVVRQIDLLAEEDVEAGFNIFAKVAGLFYDVIQWARSAME